MQRFSTLYTIGFSAAVCVVCSLLVSASAVSLRSFQSANAALDKKTNVLLAGGLIEPGESPSAQRVDELFEPIEAVVIDLATGQETEIDPATFDMEAEMKNPVTSEQAPPNDAGLARVPKHALVYKVMKEGELDELILPIQGKGLWSTLFGFLALDADGETIRGITFYQHGETPGLGGEIDNPKWKKLWIGREAFNEQWVPVIEVIKGHAGPPEEDPHQIDGLSGATITSRGVSHLVQFWLGGPNGEYGFGPYLEQLRKRGVLGHE